MGAEKVKTGESRWEKIKMGKNAGNRKPRPKNQKMYQLNYLGEPKGT